MKNLLFIMLLGASTFAYAGDKSTAPDVPTAEYIIKYEGGITKVVEFIPKANRDYRCVLVETFNKVGVGCYPAGEEETHN